jgi:hypothetical protein
MTGEGHGLGTGDGDAKRRGNGFKFRERQETKTGQTEMSVGCDDANVFSVEIIFRFRDGEQFDKPLSRAGRMKTDDG